MLDMLLPILREYNNIIQVYSDEFADYVSEYRRHIPYHECWCVRIALQYTPYCITAEWCVNGVVFLQFRVNPDLVISVCQV